MTAVINIDLNKKCTRCKKEGATPSGLCLACFAKALKRGEYDHIIKPAKPRRRPRR